MKARVPEKVGANSNGFTRLSTSKNDTETIRVKMLEHIVLIFIRLKIYQTMIDVNDLYIVLAKICRRFHASKILLYFDLCKTLLNSVSFDSRITEISPIGRRIYINSGFRLAQLHFQELHFLVCFEEIFEALQELKNSKPHRKTEITQFNKSAFIEENVDALNYFFTALILVGVTPDDLLESYKGKHRVIMKRLEDGY